MAINLSLPITFDDRDGFTLNYSPKAAIKQNFKTLILTNPGERVMEPAFGVGIKQFLFSNFSGDYRSLITAKIHEQTTMYMPSIKILDIQFADLSSDINTLSMRIVYSIPRLRTKDLLEFTI
jgi:phage baseplate assembly protein W